LHPLSVRQSEVSGSFGTVMTWHFFATSTNCFTFSVQISGYRLGWSRRLFESVFSVTASIETVKQSNWTSTLHQPLQTLQSGLTGKRQKSFLSKLSVVIKTGSTKRSPCLFDRDGDLAYLRNSPNSQSTNSWFGCKSRSDWKSGFSRIHFWGYE
jgi:hypothetical protein